MMLVMMVMDGDGDDGEFDVAGTFLGVVPFSMTYWERHPWTTHSQIEL